MVSDQIAKIFFKKIMFLNIVFPPGTITKQNQGLKYFSVWVLM